MRFLIGIPYMLRPDLLDKALSSIPPSIWDAGRICVLDNSAEPQHTQIRYVPAVPLSASQSLNFFRRLAIMEECDVLFSMHSDAAAAPDTFEKLLRQADPARHWGTIFTNYNALEVLNVQMLKEVGEWDTVLPQYFTDNDFYRRMRLAGWPSEESNLPVHHEGSVVIRNDPEKAFLNSVTFPLYAEYYRKRWGGSPGHETYARPFNLGAK